MSLVETKNAPILRFNEFIGDWTNKNLGDLGDIVNGLTYSPENICDDGVLVLRSSNVHNGQLKFDDNVYVSSQDFNPVKENDILICVRNGSKRLIGKNCLIDKKSEGLAFGAFMTVYRSNLNKFIFQLFSHQSYFKTVHKNLGATINSINNSDLKKFNFFFPEIDEQQKIAEFLSSVEKKIQLLEKKKEQLELYKKGVMQKIFSQEIRFKDENENSFPDWEEKKLEDICYKTSSNLSASDCETDSGEYPVYGASGIYTFISSFDFKEDYIAIVKDGSGVGNLIYCVSNSSVIGTMDVLRTRLNNDLKFLYYFLQTVSFKKFKVGSSIPHIYFRDYRSLKKLTPNNNEQKKIANFLSAIDKKIETTSTQIDKTKEFKKGLLQQMFV